MKAVKCANGHSYDGEKYGACPLCGRLPRGKETCAALKGIRKTIAEKNGIPLEVEECSYHGDCSGTCPRCEAELAALERALDEKEARGETVDRTAELEPPKPCEAGESYRETEPRARRIRRNAAIRGKMPAHDMEFEPEPLEGDVIVPPPLSGLVMPPPEEPRGEPREREEREEKAQAEQAKQAKPYDEPELLEGDVEAERPPEDELPEPLEGEPAVEYPPEDGGEVLMGRPAPIKADSGTDWDPPIDDLQGYIPPSKIMRFFDKLRSLFRRRR
ncbi:MAG: hypothetical protein IKI64_07925 [Clostridia bacterium]|nr:hypothetical protein [Clostridia bacterium]